VVKEFDEWPHRRWGGGEFSFEKFNLTLDCFCGGPIGMLVDIACGEILMSATGNSGWWHEEIPDIIVWVGELVWLGDRKAIQPLKDLLEK